MKVRLLNDSIKEENRRISFQLKFHKNINSSFNYLEAEIFTKNKQDVKILWDSVHSAIDNVSSYSDFTSSLRTLYRTLSYVPIKG